MTEATQATGITSREFLDKLPKKSKEDHDRPKRTPRTYVKYCYEVDHFANQLQKQW